MAAGNAGRGFRLFKSPGVAPRTRETAAQLQDNYLVMSSGADREEGGAQTPADEGEAEAAVDQLLTDFDLAPVLRRLPRGSGADVCGFRAEHLQALLGREGCLLRLRDVVKFILTAQLPQQAKEVLLTSRLLALRMGETKLRPIGAP